MFKDSDFNNKGFSAETFDEDKYIRSDVECEADCDGVCNVCWDGERLETESFSADVIECNYCDYDGEGCAKCHNCNSCCRCEGGRGTYEAESFNAPIDRKEIETLYSYVEYLEDKCGNQYDEFIDAGLDPYRTNDAESFSADNYLQEQVNCNYCGSDNIRHIKGYKCMNCANEVNYHAESFSADGESYECSWCGKDVKKGDKFYFIDGAWTTDALCVSCKEEGDDEDYEWGDLNIEEGSFDAESFSADVIECNYCDYDGEGCAKCHNCNSCCRCEGGRGTYEAESYSADGKRPQGMTSTRFRHKETGEIATRIPISEMRMWEKLDAESSLVRQAKGIDTLAEPFEDIGIPLPYARLGVMAAGLTALAFGVKKYMGK